LSRIQAARWKVEKGRLRNAEFEMSTFCQIHGFFERRELAQIGVKEAVDEAALVNKTEKSSSVISLLPCENRVAVLQEALAGRRDRRRP